MAIKLTALDDASRRFRAARARTLTEAKGYGIRTAFLCHSHLDQERARGLITLLAEKGLKLYVDWNDTRMPATPDQTTARVIKREIRDRDLFIFLATPNSMASRWCPWEIGYADATKNHSSILVVPTEDDSGRFHGNEYLQLYRRVDRNYAADLVLYEVGATAGVRVAQL